MIAIDHKDGGTVETAHQLGLKTLEPGTHHLTVLSMSFGAACGWVGGVVGKALLSGKWRRL